MTIALLWGISCGFLFGLADVFTRLGVRTSAPLVGAIIISSTVFILYGATILLRGPGPAPDWTGAIWFFLAGVCGTGPGRLLFHFSVQRIGVSRASVLLAGTPLISMLIAVVFLGERPGWTLVAGAVLIVLGIMNILSDRSGIRVGPRAAVLALIPAIFYSLSPVFSRLGILAIPDRLLGNTLTSLGVLVFLLATPPAVPRNNRWRLDPRGLWLFLVAGVIYALAFYAFYSAIALSSVSFTTPLIYTMGLFSALISRLLFQHLEQVTWRLALSAIIVFLGVFLVSRS